jgi:hypothetical protein
MPWHGKQAQAIFLKKKRELGEAGARRFMHRHGNVGDNPLIKAHRKLKKKGR